MAAGADPYIANYDLPPDDDIEVDTVQPMKDGVTPMDIADLLGDERVCNLNKVVLISKQCLFKLTPVHESVISSVKF